jgi:hypothetical protein
MTPAEFNPMDPTLEQAVTEIRDESPDPAVIEAAAARVWSRLAEAAQTTSVERPGSHQIRSCADFQALLPDLKSGHLPKARATLVRDHLHECVACRKAYEGKVVPMPVAAPARRNAHTVRWATAAAVVAAAGLSIWIAVDQFGTHTGRAFVQSVNGTLFELTAEGNLRPLAVGQDLPDGIELRTAKDSDALLQLRDGSVAELRERSGFSTTQNASDLTVHLSRGSIIVQAAKRRTGHLYVDTADCQVAVTGTVFSVSAGVKGSRVSVVQGEVHVSQNNQDKVLHPGDQTVTSASLEPLSVREDISWSRNRDRFYQQLDALRISLQQIQLPALRYDSRLLKRLPASTVMFVSVPNLADYLGEAQAVFSRNLEQSPELRARWGSHTPRLQAILEELRAGSTFLGDEIVVAGFAGPNGESQGPVFLAETRREGFAEFLKKEAPALAAETRPGLVVFGPDRQAVSAMVATIDSPAGGFQGTPFYARIAEAYKDGAGILVGADFGQQKEGPIPGARYFLGEQKEMNHQMEMRATLGFAGQRTGIAAWLADPAPMGSLDYVSPEATLVTGFVVKDPGVIVDQLLGVYQRSETAAHQTLADARQDTGQDIRHDLAASLGGEFSLSLDGPLFPIPWKLVTEAYDPARVQATLQKVVDNYNQDAAKSGRKPLRTAQENFEGRTYYMIAAAEPNALTEAHYTFAGGYLIAGPTRALVSRALQIKTAGTSITHSAQFLAMEPRDHYNNFSALVYQNLGTTLAPLAGLLGAFAPNATRPGQSNPLQNLSNMKPMLIAVYGEPDRITVAGNGNVLGSAMTGIMSGNLAGVVGNAVPFAQFQGTRVPQKSYR